MSRKKKPAASPLRRLVPTLIAAALAILSAVSIASVSLAQAKPDRWFGLPLPPPFEPHVAPAIIGDRGPEPARVPDGEARFTELNGSMIRADLETIIGFSKMSRKTAEIGDGQLWRRISGFPSSRDTIRWAAARYREAGLSNVELQSFDQDSDASFWLPLSWEVRLTGDTAFGAGTDDVVLETAMPLSPSEIEGTLSAPLVSVGEAGPAELVHIDVTGKVAVQHVTPQAHTVFERGRTVPRAQDLFRRGAVAVINIVDQPGNGRARDFSNCGGPCFNIGGRDGVFLDGVMNRAAEAGTLDQLRVQLRLETERFTRLRAENSVAVVPGQRDDETIIINAHADAWFDGAGDNADGLAVQVALAKHFAMPENQPARTLVFVASAGHHSPGLHGPRSFVRMNPEMSENAVLVLNIEHVAQRNLTPARSLFDDGYRQFVADSGEAPIVAGVSNRAPWLEDLFRQGVERYGTNFVSAGSPMASGEGGGYRQLDVALVTTMQAPPLYHTSGEVLELISTPGLERMARRLSRSTREQDRRWCEDGAAAPER